MHPVLYIESGASGLLYVNGQFCGPIDGEGQSFPCAKSAELYIQFFSFGQSAPLTAKLLLGGGRIRALAPQESCFALMWPDGVIQLELRPSAPQAPAKEEAQQVVPDALGRYLSMKLSGDGQAAALWLRAQDEQHAPDLSDYHAAVPLRFAPSGTDARFDARAGLVRRVAENVAAVDTALAMTVPAGQGRRLIERMEIVRG